MTAGALAGTVHLTRTIGLDAADWLAILRIGLGLWWLESWRHKNKQAWFEKGSGIAWAQSVADKHRWSLVRTGFSKVVAPRPKVMSYVVVYSELAVGLGVTAGFLTPIALAGGLVLNVLYFLLMFSDWAEQGQNSMMALIEIVCILAQANQAWSIDSVLHILGA
jgi:thiosulfate dehydrogenase [quinone] large subunit